MIDATSPCTHDTCITCSDQATAAQVVELRDDGRAMVDTGDHLEEVDVDLVEAAVGDVVLVHAGVAIGKLDETRDGCRPDGRSPAEA